VNLGRALAEEANLLSPRGRVLEDGAPRFFRRLAPGVLDEADLEARATELAGFVAAAGERYGFATRRVIAVGYSNGANIAGALLLGHPAVLAAAVLFRPMVPLKSVEAPDLTGVPVLIAAGSADPLVPRSETLALAALLQAGGAAVAVTYRAPGHNLTDEDLRAARTWLRLSGLGLSPS
jgi:predicted esterase